MFNIVMALAVSQIVVASPDKKTEIRIAPDGASYSIYRKGEPIVSASPMGLELAGAPDFSTLEVIDVKRQSQRRDIPLTATKAKTARDWHNGAIVTFREKAGARRTLSVEARAADEGVAFRYLLPKDAPVTLKGERTGYNLPGDPSCEVTEYSGSHENSWVLKKVSELDKAKLYDVPLVCSSVSGRTHYAIAQSGIEAYASSSLVPVEGGLKVRVSPRRDRNDVAVDSAAGLTSAWRVVMMGDRVGDLIESPLIGNLATQASGDFSWVKPGKAAWDWWSGPTAGEKPTMERFRRFIDFAAESGFPYFLIDAGWPLNATPCCDADPKTDITQSNPAIDMPALVKYADSKGVGLILWAHWKHVEPRMQEVLDTYQRWGIKGVKVDFMERDDQDMVQFYVRLAQETAKRHMLLDMHGAFPPAGLARTYPNYITQEGVMGLEYNKFSWGQVTPGHNVKLAYTRMLLGPMDYTPGGFHNSTPETYVAREIMPMTRTTRGQALAQYVVFDSPLQMISDDPAAYENAPGFDFLKAVPTAWDETRFVDGTPESHVVVARREGETWYVGAMTNEQARTVAIPLAFLGGGRFKAEIWRDGAGPNDVEHVVKSVSGRDVLDIPLSAGGGAAIVIKAVH
ncbi:glycoside hydrolase family 97 protein [Caulobacter sp. BK020]|uniref:glycoside hydrolase family 97 protein n=1 Tax=Caulobacter sp. BK020 TaxID=2512117 RepID=UPI00104845B4|nr:glycoside hydrolase family 97 protein [Caulobacter sp. BK020]TCS02516.1 alpha-glucosidase [Caulobacter sp. BK020]